MVDKDIWSVVCHYNIALLVGETLSKPRIDMKYRSCVSLSYVVKATLGVGSTGVM